MLKLFILVVSNIFFVLNIENHIICLFIMCFFHALFFFFLHFNYLYFLCNYKIQEFILVIIFGLFFPNWLVFLLKIIVFCLFSYYQQTQLLWNYYINASIIASVFFFFYFLYFFFAKIPLKNEFNLKVIKFEIRFFISFINFMIIYDFFEGNTIKSLIFKMFLMIIHFSFYAIESEDKTRY
jgi:hypothetical protein